MIFFKDFQMKGKINDKSKFIFSSDDIYIRHNDVTCTPRTGVVLSVMHINNIKHSSVNNNMNQFVFKKIKANSPVKTGKL